MAGSFLAEYVAEHHPAVEVFGTFRWRSKLDNLQDLVIQVGDLDSRRDWTDTRDMVRAYWLATERGEPGEVYNVGRGTCIRVGDMLDILLSHSNVEIAK